MPNRIFLLLQVCALPVAPFAAYLLGLVLGLRGTEATGAVLVMLPVVVIFCGNVYPLLVIRILHSAATRVNPGEPAGRRLRRLLKLPWRVAIYAMAGSYSLGGLVFGVPVCLWFGKPVTLGLLGGAMGTCIGLLLAFPAGIMTERWVLPLVLEEYESNPGVRTTERSFFWPRQAWFLPYAFVVSLLAQLLLAAAVVFVQLSGLRNRVVQMLQDAGEMRAGDLLEKFSSPLLADMSTPLAVMTVLLLTLPTLSAWMLARRQERGAKAVLHAIEGLTSGRILKPRWISTDEIGDLAYGLDCMLHQLKAIPRTLEQSATRLFDASSVLSKAHEAQRQAVTSQVVAIQETSVTANEIRQTSEVAAQRAQAVLDVALRAEELGRNGASAVQGTLKGLNSIRDSVLATREKINLLQQSARQIGEITLTVKDLADQSNMLALNAAIEAVRSGEHGRGFSVVAREIRNLADQSIKATARIRAILDQVSSAIDSAVAMSDASAQQVEGNLERTRTSGASLSQLSEIVNETSLATRQIAASVSQQNAGISQIFTAVADLSKLTDQTMCLLESSQEASQTLQNVSEQVSQAARQYRSE